MRRAAVLSIVGLVMAILVGGCGSTGGSACVDPIAYERLRSQLQNLPAAGPEVYEEQAQIYLDIAELTKEADPELSDASLEYARQLRAAKATYDLGGGDRFIGEMQELNRQLILLGDRLDRIQLCGEPEPGQADGGDEASRMTAEQAAQTYLEAVYPANNAIADFESRGGRNATPETASEAQRQSARDAAAAASLGAQKLRNPLQQWPSNVSMEVLGVAQMLEADAEWFGSWAQAKTTDELPVYTNDTMAAEQVRARLGLPPASASDTGC